MKEILNVLGLALMIIGPLMLFVSLVVNPDDFYTIIKRFFSFKKNKSIKINNDFSKYVYGDSIIIKFKIIKDEYYSSAREYVKKYKLIYAIDNKLLLMNEELIYNCSNNPFGKNNYFPSTLDEFNHWFNKNNESSSYVNLMNIKDKTYPLSFGNDGREVYQARITEFENSSLNKRKEKQIILNDIQSFKELNETNIEINNEIKKQLEQQL